MTIWDYLAIGALFFAATIGAGFILIAVEKAGDE